MARTKQIVRKMSAAKTIKSNLAEEKLRRAEERFRLRELAKAAKLIPADAEPRVTRKKFSEQQSARAACDF